ncbi:MAG: glutamyl-tRNA reductase [Rhodospirillales bacterium]|jgi:glutamyl-tRNA reductase|nr:glutamyl-tRNA reductase [Rhodospirillales bacterium]HIJ43928.1 glutamyl-tRNA reductase [Rhodospirillaceae bacterium]MDP7098795.1 glutamyl-tRNA reductase [Rhodospirillales bacterium]MDP7215479.1 glutamyl-tRNA reductase [Rhodospirillales bacterium]HIJ44600.1 glutamyl-tRNA reductase [Rhodospirillaceae bacterium]
MAEPFSTQGRPLVVGANHRSSSMMLRDRLFIEDRALPEFFERLRLSGIGQALVLSTCDRIEIQTIHDDHQAAVQGIIKVMAAHGGVSPADLDGQIYTFSDTEAVRHIFTVPASLDSMMLGEPQVFGQVKASHKIAQNRGMIGGELEALLQAAYAAAKRVRNETTIGERPVSIASAAVELARELHGDLGRCAGLLIGSGEMGELVAENLISAGLGDLTVTHPTEAMAETLARVLDCHMASFESLAKLLINADIVLTSLGTRRHVVTADMITASLAKRRRKPIYLIDVAIPGDVDPAVNRIDGAFLYDLGDLERVALEGRATRGIEAEAAFGIVDAEVAAFLLGRAERTAVPALTGLRRHFEAVREGVLAEVGDDADKATRLLVNRLLHGPSEVMRADAARQEDWNTVERILRRLFDLGGEDGDASEKEE